MFHVNPATGEAGKCTATKGKCPFGGLDEHYTSIEAARYSYEKKMEAGALEAAKKDGRSIRGNWPELELYRGQIESFSEVFVHPQGKIAFTTSRHHDRLTVMKAGKRASTSGSLADMQAGRGAWKQIKKVNEPLPSKEDYEKNFDSNPTVATSKGKVPLAKVLSPQEAAAVAAGYPSDTPFDARKANEIAQSGRVNVTYATYRSKAASILPLNERGNPHKLMDMPLGDKLRFWNTKDANGNETSGTTFEVWSDNAGHYKAVATSGPIYELGSTSGFRHDQTWAQMGGEWELVGAFQPVKDGAIIGDVPNKSMPIYTYK